MAKSLNALDVIRRLTRAAKNPYLDKPFRDIVSDPDVFDLGLQDFVQIIERDDLRHQSEEKEIFAFAVKWLVKHERTHHMYKVLSNIRFFKMSKEDILYCSALSKEHLGGTKQFNDLVNYAKIRDSPMIKIQQRADSYSLSRIEEKQDIDLHRVHLHADVLNNWTGEEYRGKTVYEND